MSIWKDWRGSPKRVPLPLKPWAKTRDKEIGTQIPYRSGWCWRIWSIFVDKKVSRYWPHLHFRHTLRISRQARVDHQEGSVLKHCHLREAAAGRPAQEGDWQTGLCLHSCLLVFLCLMKRRWEGPQRNMQTQLPWPSLNEKKTPSKVEFSDWQDNNNPIPVQFSCLPWS